MRANKAEIFFDIAYLLSTLYMGFAIFEKNASWALMSFILVLGDSTHLIPRIYQFATNKKSPRLLGYGKMITSITMSVFYVLLWQIGSQLYSNTNSHFSIVIYILCAIRIILCLLPQNQWINEKPSYIWGIYRNIPFFLQGVMAFFLYFINRTEIIGLKSMYVAILFSFAFYIPVVLWAQKKPFLGMLMIPKTLCYVWIVAMGFYI